MHFTLVTLRICSVLSSFLLLIRKDQKHQPAARGGQSFLWTLRSNWRGSWRYGSRAASVPTKWLRLSKSHFYKEWIQIESRVSVKNSLKNVCPWSKTGRLPSNSNRIPGIYVYSNGNLHLSWYFSIVPRLLESLTGSLQMKPLTYCETRRSLERYSVIMNWKNHYVKLPILLKSKHRFHVIPIKIPMVFFKVKQKKKF